MGLRRAGRARRIVEDKYRKMKSVGNKSALKWRNFKCVVKGRTREKKRGRKREREKEREKKRRRKRGQ
jgi:hypothetical protein